MQTKIDALRRSSIAEEEKVRTALKKSREVCVFCVGVGVGVWGYETNSNIGKQVKVIINIIIIRF